MLTVVLFVHVLSACPFLGGPDIGVEGIFSSPAAENICCCPGVTFPWFVDTFKARSEGVLCVDRCRRTMGRTALALGGYGTANGGGVDVGNKTKLLF